jgi:hypothetical protein
MAVRIAAGIMTAIFGLSVVVQFNDPDPHLWVLLYGVPAILSILAVFRIFNPMAGLLALLYLFAFIFLMPWGHLDEVPGYVSTVHMTSQESEWAREGIGLLIAAFWMAFLAWQWYRNADEQQSREVTA